jgi:F plasmid transfer operon, TraF, protein
MMRMDRNWGIFEMNVRRPWALVLGMAATRLWAAPLYLPPGSDLTFGEVTHSQRVMSAANNPAAAAAAIARGGELSGGAVGGGMAANFSVGLEYGNLDELFDTIDSLARKYKPTDPDEGGGGPGQNPDDKPPGGIDIGDIIDTNFPELRPALEAAATEVAAQAALLGFIRNEGYARAFVSADVPFLIGREMLGGSWTFGLGWSGTSRTFGVVDDTIDFDIDAALQELEQKIRDAALQPGQLPTRFDVTGDVDFTVDPSTNLISASLDNDSLLLSKSSQMKQVSVGYSRRVIDSARGQLFVGGEGKLYDLELSRVSVRFGDITDSQELFDSIRNANLRSASGAGVDVGALWVGRRYQVGATLTNVNEPEFRYPGVDLTPYRDSRILQTLLDDQLYTMERQLKLEASLFTESRRWAVNVGVDANAAPDPVGDEFQWATISGGFTTNTNWLPNVRLGYRRNLAGTEITYLSAGIQIFKLFNLDIASALDTVSIDDTKLPQGLTLNLGFLIDF